MKKFPVFLIIIVAIFLISIVAILALNSENNNITNQANLESNNVINNIEKKSDLIKVSAPKPNDLVKSPLVITGEARGTWFFEASFPIKLLDSNNQEIAIGIAQAKSDWMTENFVPFEATLTFNAPTAKTGKLILKKDNPSGDPARDDQLEIPVNFNSSAIQERTINLYYYQAEKDKDISENILCSSKGLVSVQRKIPITNTPIQDTIKLLLEGNLTSEEKTAGITTEYPLAGVALTGASLNSGVLTLSFTDPNNKTSGGSCRVAILWAQIEATAKQFSEVKSVKFLPEELFQP